MARRNVGGRSSGVRWIKYYYDDSITPQTIEWEASDWIGVVHTGTAPTIALAEVAAMVAWQLNPGATPSPPVPVVPVVPVVEGVVTCSNCGATSRSGTPYCSACGQSLSTQVASSGEPFDWNAFWAPVSVPEAQEATSPWTEVEAVVDSWSARVTTWGSVTAEFGFTSSGEYGSGRGGSW